MVAPSLVRASTRHLRLAGRGGCLDGRHDLLSGAGLRCRCSTIATPDALPCFPAVLPMVAMMDGFTDEPAWIPGTSSALSSPRHAGRLPGRLDALPIPAMNARVNVPASVRHVRPRSRPGASMERNRRNPTRSPRLPPRRPRHDDLRSVNRPHKQPLPCSWADVRRIASRRCSSSAGVAVKYRRRRLQPLPQEVERPSLNL